MTEFLTILTAVEERVFGLDAQAIVVIIAQLFNFLVLAFILSKLLYKPVKNFMQKRTDRIVGQFDQAKKDMGEALRLRTLYDEKLREIEVERDGIIETARKAANESGEQIITEARKEADEMIVRAKANIQLELEHAREEMRLQIIAVSMAMTERFLTKNITNEEQNRLFDETVAELEETAWRS